MSTTDFEAGTPVDDAPNNPDIDIETGRIRQRAVKNAKQAFSIAKNLERANRKRDAKNADICKKYNGDQPFNAAKLKAAGQDWRNNANTEFMASIVDRKVPEFVNMIESARVLTNAALPVGHPDGAIKSDKFRRRFTDYVRSWEDWRDFLTQTAAENLLYGYACPACTDPYDWRPELFTQSNFYVPENSAQSAKKLQTLILRKDFTIDEAIRKLADSDSFSLAGWNIVNWVKEINNAMPKNKAWTIDESNWREFVDQIRDGTLYESLNTSNKVIQTFDCYFKEASGRVTQYIVSYKDGKELFKQEDRYKGMQDVCTLVSLQAGNLKLHGSKGAGRKVFNIHVSAEKNRNMFLDAVNLSTNKIIVIKTQDFAKANKIKLTVASPFAIVVTDGEILENADFKPDIEVFGAAESLLTHLAEVIVGAVLPGVAGIEDNPKETATKSTIDAQRENEIKVGVLARWAYQFSRVIGMMQKRICIIDTTDEEAQKFQEELMKKDGLTAEEIQMLAECPPAKNLSDIAAIQTQALQEFLLKYGGTPFIDMNKVVERDANQILGPELAEEILLTPDTQQANEVEQIRQQTIECATMLATQQPVAVSTRDNHELHRAELKRQLMILASVLPQNPDPLLAHAVELGFTHMQEHIDMQLQQGAKPSDVAEDSLWLRDAVKTFTMAQKAVKEALKQSQPDMPTTIPGNPQPLL